MENLITEQRAREKLGGLSTSTLKRLVRTGELPVVRIRGRVLFRPQDIEAFVERNLRAKGRS